MPETEPGIDAYHAAIEAAVHKCTDARNAAYDAMQPHMRAYEEACRVADETQHDECRKARDEWYAVLAAAGLGPDGKKLADA